MAVAFDQVHEQNNAVVRGDGGAVGLTEDQEQLRRWMLKGPDVQGLLHEFEWGTSRQQGNGLHHEEYQAFQENFQEKVSKFW